MKCIMKYFLFYLEVKSSGKTGEDVINRCVDCSRESWKTKSFAHIGMNTELSVNPSSSVEKFSVVKQDEADQLDNQQPNVTSKTSPTPDLESAASFVQQKDYSISKSKTTEVDTPPKSPKQRFATPAHEGFGMFHSHHQHGHMRYPDTSSRHCDRFVRTWMMEKTRYERRSPSSRGEQQLSPRNIRRSSHAHHHRSRSPLSPHHFESRHRPHDYPSQHYHGGIYENYRPVLLPAYPHEHSLHNRREEKLHYGEDEKVRVITHAHQGHTHVTDVHDKSHRSQAHSGEQPPVFVLPNDYDVVSGGIDPRLMSMQERRLTKHSPPPSVSKERENADQKQLAEKSNEKSPPHQQKFVKDEFQNSPPNTGGSSNGGDSPDSCKTPTTSKISQKLFCKICSGVFPTKSLLYKHLRGHTSDEKPFKCNECGQGFTLSSNLRQHRIIHRGYKPFQCEFCGKKFMRSNVYKQHRRIHTGEEMHKCGICPSEFLQKYALLKHMKKNHNIDAIDN